jgi:hypothetical protein
MLILFILIQSETNMGFRQLSNREGSVAADEFRPDAEDGAPARSEGELLRQVLAALRSLRYGCVTLTVHEGRVVEIQRTEKLRVKGLKTPP